MAEEAAQTRLKDLETERNQTLAEAQGFEQFVESFSVKALNKHKEHTPRPQSPHESPHIGATELCVWGSGSSGSGCKTRTRLVGILS